jgi:DNA-binding transcriptional LysR family regulator
MLALSDRALESVRGVAFVGELRLAITDYFLPSSITDLLKKLRVRYPHLRWHVSVRNSMQIERGGFR